MVSMPRKIVVSLLFSIVLLMSSSPLLAQTAVGTVNTGSLNVRSGPGLNYGSILTLPNGFGVEIVARNREANWVFIRLTNGTTGWVNVNYLYTTFRIWDLPVNEAAPASNITPTATIAQYSINVYNAPQPNAQVVGTVSLNQQVDLLGRNFDSGWAQIRAGGLTGWVRAGDIVSSVPVRSLAPSDGSVPAPQPGTGGVPVNPNTGQQGGGSNARVHVVAAGETLSGIAQRYGVNLYTLAQANGIINLNFIYSGQRLVVP
jgi:uncharacterized protein YraI